MHFQAINLTKKAWVVPNGKTVSVPKDEGIGVMISAFQSHEFGFGLQLSDKQLANIKKVL